MSKVEKKLALLNALNGCMNDIQWRLDSAKQRVEDYASKKNDEFYNWEEYDDKELEERKYILECYETIIATLEKLV